MWNKIKAAIAAFFFASIILATPIILSILAFIGTAAGIILIAIAIYYAFTVDTSEDKKDGS